MNPAKTAALTLEKAKPAPKPKANACARCSAPLGALFYFCTPCWGLIPGGERAALYAMHHRKQDTASKVLKCVRIIERKRAALAHVPEPAPAPN